MKKEKQDSGSNPEPSLSDIFEEIIKRAHKRSEQPFGISGISTAEEQIKIQEFLNRPHNQNLLEELSSGKNRQEIGVVWKTTLTRSGKATHVSYFTDDGHGMGFCSDKRIEVYKNVLGEFEFGDIIQLELTGTEIRKITKLRLPLEKEIEFIKKTIESVEKNNIKNPI